MGQTIPYKDLKHDTTYRGNGKLFVPPHEKWKFEIVAEGSEPLSTVIEGPRTHTYTTDTRASKLEEYVARGGEYLEEWHHDGTSKISPGPTRTYLDLATHKKIEVKEALRLESNECLVIYRGTSSRLDDETSQNNDIDDSSIPRSDVIPVILSGPSLYVPSSTSEWIRSFKWTGEEDPNRPAGSRAVRIKKRNALSFQKLRVSPDQTYIDVENAVTKDDVSLTVQLMIFFRLVDVHKMLKETHDPIADFVNSASSDVLEFVRQCGGFEELKEQTCKLNELATFVQLTSQAHRIGYDITKVVFRGYQAPEAVQQLQHVALESRMKLRLQQEQAEQEEELTSRRLKLEEEEARRKQDMARSEAELKLDLQKCRCSAELEEATKAIELEKLKGQAEAERLKALRDALGEDCFKHYLQTSATEKMTPSKVIQYQIISENSNDAVRIGAQLRLQEDDA